MSEVERDSRLPSIQVLRGIAASLVVLYHYSGLFEGLGLRHSWIVQSGIGNLGAGGVDIFFVISGFIMVYTTTRKAGGSDALIFLKRRAHRIYPLYWIWTTVLLVLWGIGFALKTYHFSLGYLVDSYLLIPTYDGITFRPLLGVGWTLSFEMFFYVAFSCAILLKLKWGKLPFLFGFFAAAFFCGMYLPLRSGMRFLFTDPIILEFLFGVLAAEILLWLPSIINDKPARMLSGALIVVGGAALLVTTRFHLSESMRYGYYGIPALLIVAGAAMLGSRQWPRWLVYLGDASYSIYLTHTIAVMAFDWMLRHLHLIARVSPDASILLAAPITIGLCSLTYPLVERRLIPFVVPRKAPTSVPA